MFHKIWDFGLCDTQFGPEGHEQLTIWHWVQIHIQWLSTKGTVLSTHKKLKNEKSNLESLPYLW